MCVKPSCINRNIVECKAVLWTELSAGCTVLIETLWNVKTYTQSDKDIKAFRINRNIVECKGETRT